MNENNFIADISEQRLIDIDKERTETMSKKEFNDWVRELRVSASYVDVYLHNCNSTDMMNMIDRERWIATFERLNKINN